MAIKEVMMEELKNSRQMADDYEAALARLPKGNLIRKKIKGRDYFYLQVRDGGKVRFDYVKNPSVAMIEKYRRAKAARVKYRSLLAQAKRQIKFLERIVRARQAV